MIKNSILYLIMISLILLVGFVQSWNVALLILNMCIISSIMSLGVNIQYGYAGLFNLGIMGFVALGGLATVIISAPPVYEAWDAGGIRIIIALSFGADDFGGTLFDENVMLSAGFYNRTSVDGIKKLINAAGFEAVQRTTEYDLMEVTSKVV